MESTGAKTIIKVLKNILMKENLTLKETEVALQRCS